MKYIILLILTFFSIISFGQIDSLPNNSPSPKSPSTWPEYGYLKVDNGFINAIRDTAWQPKYIGTEVLWYHNGVDTAKWIYTGAVLGRKWIKVGTGGSSGGSSTTPSLYQVTHINNTTNLPILIRTDNYSAMSVIDTVTGKFAQIGLSSSGSRPQLILGAGAYTFTLDGNALTGNATVAAPDSNGTLSVAGRLNGITYPANSKGVIDFGKITLSTDTSLIPDSSNIQIFVDSTVSVAPTTHTASQKVLISKTPTGINFGSRANFVATWNSIDGVWNYTDPSTLAIGTALSDANINSPGLYKWDGTQWIKGVVYIPNGGLKIVQPIVIGSKDAQPVVLQSNSVQSVTVYPSGDIELNKWKGFNSNNYVSIDSATGDIVPKIFNPFVLTTNAGSLASFTNDTLNIPPSSGSSSTTLQQAFDASVTAGDDPQIFIQNDNQEINFTNKTEDNSLQTTFDMSTGIMDLGSYNLVNNDNSDISINTDAITITATNTTTYNAASVKIKNTGLEFLSSLNSYKFQSQDYAFPTAQGTAGQVLGIDSVDGDSKATLSWKDVSGSTQTWEQTLQQQGSTAFTTDNTVDFGGHELDLDSLSAFSATAKSNPANANAYGDIFYDNTTSLLELVNDTLNAGASTGFAAGDIEATLGSERHDATFPDASHIIRVHPDYIFFDAGTGNKVKLIANVDSSNADPNNVAWFDASNILHRGHITSSLYHLPYNGLSNNYLGGDTLYHVLPSYTASSGIVIQGNNIKLQDTLNGAGTKFMFLNGAKNGAFRVGKTNSGTEWDIDSIGNGSVATGFGTKAIGGYSFASNFNSQARGSYSIAMGYFAYASSAGFNGAIGATSNALGSSSYAFGYGDSSIAQYSHAYGYRTVSKDYYGTTIGCYNDTSAAANPTNFSFSNRAFQVGIGNVAPVTHKNGLTVYFSGKTQLNQYGAGTFTGTPAYNIEVDASGNFIETAVPSGGSGSGTVTSGTINTLAYYNSTGTSVSGLTAITGNRALVSNSSGLPIASSTTDTELGYVTGVTSSIQTQINSNSTNIALKYDKTGGNLTAGAFLGFPKLLARPSTPATGFVSTYYDSLSRFSYVNASGYNRTFRVPYSGDVLVTYPSIANPIIEDSNHAASTYAPIFSGTGYTKYSSGTLSYVTSIPDADIAALSYSKLTGNPTTISGYGITDAATLTTTQTLTNKTLSKPIISGGILTNSSLPTITGGTGAGTAPTITLSSNSNDITGTITVLAGTTPSASSNIVTLTFSTTLTQVPRAVIVTPIGNTAALHDTRWYVDGTTLSTTSFIIKATSTALAAGSTYNFAYVVLQ